MEASKGFPLPSVSFGRFNIFFSKLSCLKNIQQNGSHKAHGHYHELLVDGPTTACSCHQWKVPAWKSNWNPSRYDAYGWRIAGSDWSTGSKWDSQGASEKSNTELHWSCAFKLVRHNRWWQLSWVLRSNQLLLPALRNITLVSNTDIFEERIVSCLPNIPCKLKSNFNITCDFNYDLPTTCLDYKTYQRNPWIGDLTAVW